LAIEFGGDVGLPVFGDLGKLLGDVDFGHGTSVDCLRQFMSFDCLRATKVARNLAWTGQSPVPTRAKAKAASLR
jgi:hypothetical protein